MEKQTLAKISRESGKSISTVSKVLRSCPGVTAETRETVLRAAYANHIPQGRRSAPIVAILPDTPKFFWEQTHRAIRGCGTEIALKVYSSIGEGDTTAILKRYLSEAIDTGARAIILSARPDADLRETLSEIAKEHLVIQLCEYVPVPNTFFVGSDAEHDGALLAETVPEGRGAVSVGVLRCRNYPIEEGRMRGFLSALPRNARVVTVDAPPERSELYSAHLARAIDACGVPLDYFFCTDGITVSACEALHKLRGKMDARLLGFELPRSAEKYVASGRIAAVAVQRPDLQMKHAVGLARRYVTEGLFPDSKYSFVPSELRKT
ncbi:MAG: LacI family DNA-binding transcriptional regulator [Clostridia bacterium]|nr:LacI family DNA-binding transcriptional regulator [Clostridia bacterium]